MRLPSGVPGFDALVQGGIPSGAAVVIQGPAGGEKDAFLFQFIAEGLRGGACALVVLSSVSPARYLQELRETGIDVDSALAEGRLKFVDWFSYKEDPVHDVEQDGPVFRASIDLANVGIAISRAVGSLPRDIERRAAVEVLSPALSAYDLSAVYGFAQSTKAKLERSGFTSLFVIEKDMHDERAISSIQQPFDGVVDLERTRDGDRLVRKIAVLSLRGTAAKSEYNVLEEGADRVLRVSADPMRERTLQHQRDLIKSNPKDPKLWLATARNLRSMGENDRALRCVDAALNLDSKDPDAWRFKAEVLDALGRRDEAEQARARAAAPVPSERKKVATIPRRTEGTVARLAPEPVVAPGKKEDSANRILNLVNQRLRDNPNDPDALFALAAVLARANDLLGAVSVLEKLAEIDERYPGLWLLKTQLHARRGDVQQAEASRARRLEIEKLVEREAEAALVRPIEESSPAQAPPTPARPPAFYCPTCGSAVRDDDASCPSCGARFSAPEAPPVLPSVAKPEPGPPPRPKKPEPDIPIARPVAPEPRPEPQAKQTPTPKAERRPASPRARKERGRTNGLTKEPPRGTGRTNGLVNGLRGRTNGLVNGSRGRTNGLVNGTRGRTNGLVNGTRGRTNGLVNGTRGRTNGLVNGTRGRTNGLVNGLRSMRSGLTNGLTNGSGFTNGLGSSRLAREASTGRWKVYVIPLITIVMLLIPILGPSVETGPTGMILDGESSDWNPLRIAPQARSPGTNPNVDIVSAGFEDDGYSFWIIVEVDGTMLVGGPPAGTDRFHVFLDTDGLPTTGYAVDSLGADRLLDVSGHNGTVTHTAILAWDPSAGPNDWRGWDPLGFASAVARESRLEMRVDRLAIDSDRSPVVAAIHGRAFDRTSDSSDGVLHSAGGTLLVVQEPVVVDLLTGPAAALLLQLDISALGGDSTISGLTVTLTGVANTTAVTSLRLSDGVGNLIDQTIPIGPRANFQIPPRVIIPSAPQRFFVIADVLPSDGSTLGATISDPSDVQADSPVSVRRAASPRDVGYLSLVPPLPRVDGGFAEWTGTLADPPGDAGKADVDLTGFDARFSGGASYFYAAVDGRILSGTWVPEGNRAVFLGGQPLDSDRDTVPDAQDPYPLDFNNDLVPDAESGGDLDADTVLDYGLAGGTDWWLNTTIPGTFPAPYADRPVSVYIGPWDPPFQTRDDVLRVFVDLNNSTCLGYSIASLCADRLVEISGTEGRVRTADFFAFGGSYPGEWLWIPLSQATVATGFDRMEFSVVENLSATGARMFVEAQAPLGSNDDMDGTRGTRSAHADSTESEAQGSSFDIASSPILETLRTRTFPMTRGASDPPQTLDISGNQKLYLRDSNHAETACTTNKEALTSQGSAPAASTALSTGQSICWYADSTSGTTIAAGNWETLLDVSFSTYNAKVDAFNIGTGAAGTNVNITGVGFQPKVVILWWSGRTETSDTAGTLTHKRGFGVAVSPTDRRAICSWSEHGAASGSHDVGGAHRADAAICSMSGEQAIDGRADLAWMHSDGFTMVIDDNFATSLRIHYLALGGTSLTDVKSGMFTEPTGTGNQDVTTVGFQPDAVILFSSMISADPAGVCYDAVLEETCNLMMVGFAAGAGNPNDVVWAGGSDDNAVQTISYHRATESIALMDFFATVTNGRAQVDQWLSNGFSLDWAEKSASCGSTCRRIHYLALKGGSYVVGDLTTSDVLDADVVESGFGFSPKASLFVSHNKAQSSSDTPQDHDELSLGSFSATNARGAQCVKDEDAQSTSDVSTAVEHDEVYCNLSTANAIEGLMDIQSVDSGGFTLNMDDPDPSASFVGYLAFGADITYDVSLEIWNKDTNTIRATIGSCTDVTTTGDDVQCLVSGVSSQTLASNEVVRVRVVHSGGTGTVTIEYDDGDATGDSRITFPVSEFEEVVLTVVTAVLVPVVWRSSRRRKSARRREASP